VRFLLDTHVALWVLGEPERLAVSTRSALTESGVSVAVSIASLWEVAIKHGLGKLDQPPAVIARGLDDAGASLLGLTVADVVAVGSLPAHHLDLFDRMIVAQALVGGWTVVTRDAVLAQYGVPVMQA
jgi:PIN domain nuclease of toxin-antitoxin system